MFSNIGGKIKTLAVVVCVLGSIASFVSGVIMLTVGAVNGLLIILVGVLGSWIGTLCLYGFGQLIEDTSAIRVPSIMSYYMREGTSVSLILRF